MDLPPQGVITKDNVTLTIDTVVFFQVTDPFKAIYEIESLQKAISYVAVTTMRDIIGKMDLDNTFTSRDLINDQLRSILDDATDKWGVKVERVEVKDIRPPADIRDAMEKQMNAERNKRAVILEAEGERQSAITRAGGEKEAAILNAEAEKEANIRRAEGIRQAKILEAHGEAEAIRQIAEAKAQEVTLIYGAIKAAKPDDTLVALKSLEALEKVAEGPANKVFIPFDATKTLASVSAMVEAKN
jgi:regulator of protease activity HflC (stomatin/prohibitin superfamily)